MDGTRPGGIRSASELALSLRSLRLPQSVCEFRNHALVGICRYGGPARRLLRRLTSRLSSEF